MCVSYVTMHVFLLFRELFDYVLLKILYNDSPLFWGCVMFLGMSYDENPFFLTSFFTNRNVFLCVPPNWSFVTSTNGCSFVPPCPTFLLPSTQKLIKTKNFRSIGRCIIFYFNLFLHFLSLDIGFCWTLLFGVI